MRRKFRPPNVPFIEAYNKGGKHKPTAILLEPTFTTSVKGAAFGIANNLHRSKDLGSWHYVVDEAETYRCVWDNLVALSDPSEDSRGILSVKICLDPAKKFAWDDPQPSALLRRTADLVAQLSLAYKIPTRYLDRSEEARWRAHRRRSRGGIILNIPGDWPTGRFMSLVSLQKTIKTTLLED